MSTEPPARFADAFDRAHEEAGEADFGAPDYREGLQVLLASMDEDSDFTPRGRALAWDGVVAGLAARGRTYRALAQHPGHAAVAIPAPVVITGIPRSGTTALHRLLAVDARFQGFQTWLLDAPMPRPQRAEWDAHPQFQRSVAEIAARHAIAPDKAAAHQSVAEGLEEDCMMLRHSFTSNIWNCMGWRTHAYDRWWQQQDEAAAYRYLKRGIQLVGSTAPGQRWLLKNPGHIHHPEQLFAIFPDAKVIQTHRDPAKAIPSICSLLVKLHPVMEQGPVEARAHEIGARETAKWAAGVHAMDAARAGGREDQVLDIVHGDFHRDPMGVVERIYAFLGMDITDDLRPLLAARIAAKPELQHGPHHYSLAEFGLTADGVREVFGDYTARYAMQENAR